MNQLTQKDYEKYFSLKPVQTAKVSEISEKTASSDIPAKDKLNFHIGNPVLDNRLLRYFLNSLYQTDKEKFDQNLNVNLKNRGTDETEINRTEFIKKVVEKSSSYMPGGGYSAKAPNSLIKHFIKWLNEDQQEPLRYSISGKRECIITNGGIYETLRIIFYAFSKYFKHKNINILTLDIVVPEHVKNIKNINCSDIKSNGVNLLNVLNEKLQTLPEEPLFLILGKVLSEEERRALRILVCSFPVMIIEANESPNHLSTAREAGLENRVLRILSPGIFNEKWKDIPLNFICGNEHFIKIFETVHFQLLGTPSASEVEFLSYLIENPVKEGKDNETTPDTEKDIKLKNKPAIQLDSFSGKIKNITENRYFKLNERIRGFSLSTERQLDKYESSSARYFALDSKLKTEKTSELVKKYLSFDKNVFENITSDFLTEFCTHHPEYEKEYSFAVSGSARTALGLIGFHCGIEEVVIPDLSWTYEHCFPKINAVPLKEGLKLDDKAVIDFVEKKLTGAENWNKKSAVVINNPHNATGKVFPQRKLVNLLKYLLNNKVYVIDDLSYQNVAPDKKELNISKTLKQIADELIKKGYVPKDRGKYLITVHSLSKTDCFAGARLSVANIPDEFLRQKFENLIKYIKPNNTAILTGYLFYRNDPERVNGFWGLRNQIFAERMQGISEACENISAERNIFDIEIIPPAGSMYPQLRINKLPSGLSLDWLASSLASQGIGMVPLSTFARTKKGFETARKMFRLTLGGSDSDIELKRKTRRLLIDLNRLISEESAKYNLNKISYTENLSEFTFDKIKIDDFIKITESLKEKCLAGFDKHLDKLSNGLSKTDLKETFSEKYFQDRVSVFQERLKDHLLNLELIKKKVKNNEKQDVIENLKKELCEDDLKERSEIFRKRLFDRTVHPTQAYSLKVDLMFNKIIDSVLKEEKISGHFAQELSDTLIDEYLGVNVAIKSVEEADELIADLETLILSEEYLSLVSEEELTSFLSFWGDWDGSNRPSGQGHRLVAAAVVENVNRLSNLLTGLKEIAPGVTLPENLSSSIKNLKEENKKFWDLLNKITQLTNQLEKRYQSLLPYEIQSGKLKRLGIKMGMLKDPITSLWQHNDSLEKKMISLRSERKERLKKYFELNEELRKTLFGLLPEIEKNLEDTEFFITAARYKNILKRFVLTPRIHQKLITAKDQFSIDTTVHNIIEINEISGSCGNPGMVMALQVSMSSNAEALIALDRKLRAQREEVLRANKETVIPAIWTIPLFEDVESVNQVKTYLDKIWQYALQVKEINQEVKERFLEMICEIFIAGSDLSQQISQTASADLYNQVKFNVIKWLAEKGITQEVRMKLGSGEPMQRQGGYYNVFSGKSAFLNSADTKKILTGNLSGSAYQSTKYATTPLLGIASRGDLRTFQSNVSEHIRNLKNNERTELIYHVQEIQKVHREELIRAAEPMIQTRFKFEEKEIYELKRLTIGQKDEVYDEFVNLVQENFQNILYGSDEDVVGIHLISYFISRTTPTLRDRPTVRPSKETGNNRGEQIIERIAKTIPMNRQGSALRAIGHNRAQTVILGVNQLTTGMFRSLKELNERYSHSGNISPVIEDAILPRLPVYEILTALKYYEDYDLEIVDRMYKAFPAGNSAFTKLREDNDSMFDFIKVLQKELLRRHGINTREFFDDNNNFNEKLLPCLRPDLAVLMQNDFFNTDIKQLLKQIDKGVEEKWVEQVTGFLEIRDEVKKWRKEIWKMLDEPIFQQVKSFVELALSLSKLSSTSSEKEIRMSDTDSNVLKLDQNIVDLLKGSVDDTMRQFLQAAVHYLTSLPESRKEIPIDIVRAIKDVERILKIEEQALSPKEQKLFNFYILQIARLCRENG